MKNILPFLSSPYGLFVHFFLLILVSMALLNKPIKEFKNLDPAPKQYNLKNESVTKVEAGFGLENFAEFDILKNKFIAEGFIWFIFDPKKISLEKLSKFSINNGCILEKNEPIILKIKDLIMARFHVRFSFTNNIYYRNFPLDDHTIYIELKNDTLTNNDIEFFVKKENFTQTLNLGAPGWTIIGSDAKAGYNKTLLKETDPEIAIFGPQVIFSLDHDRSGHHLIIILLLPLLLLFFAALSVFMVQVPSFFDASNTFMGSLFALVGYLFISETISPQVGYMMLSNYIYLSVLLCTFIIAILGWAGNKLSHAQRGLIGTIIELFLIFLLFWFIFIWR